MAIEDGMVLARCVKSFGTNIKGGLKRYEKLRMERTAKATKASNENSGRFHNSQLGDPKIAERYVNTEWEPDQVRKRYDWLFTYDATSVKI